MSTATALQVAHTNRSIQQQDFYEQLHTFEQIWKFSETVAASSFAPKDYIGKPGNVFVAIQMGRELGVPPMQAIQGIAVINGRPGVWGDLMWALVTSHPQFEDAVESVDEKQATCKLSRRGRSPVEVTFTMADAVLAGIDKNAVWKTYPKRMLKWRARTFAARDLFADALKGIISIEELQDYDAGPTIDAAAGGGARASLPAGATVSTVTAVKVEDKPVVITEDEAKEFGKAWKASGHTITDAKAWLLEAVKVRSSLEIPKSEYAKAMAWAKTPKAQPEQKVESQTEQTPDEKIARELMGILQMNEDEQKALQKAFIDEAKGDWAALVKTLQARLPE